MIEFWQLTGTVPGLEHAQVQLSIAPLVVAGAVYGAGKLLKGLFGHLSGKKKAAALKKAQEAQLAARKAGHEVDETRRVGRLGGIQQGIQSVQGSLAPGAPNYAFSPETLATLQTRRPFDETLPPDPKAGLGSAYLSGLSGDISDLAALYAKGSGGMSQGAGGTAQSASGASGPISGSALDTGNLGTGGMTWLDRLKYNQQAQNPWGF